MTTTVTFFTQKNVTTPSEFYDSLPRTWVVHGSNVLEETRILRMPEVMRMTGLSRAGVYKLMKAGPPLTFPRPIKLGIRAVGWRRADLEAWLASRAEGGTAA